MSRVTDRVLFAVIGALAIALIGVLAGVVDAGPLDPPGPPGSTMKTLDEIPGSWIRRLASNDGSNGDETPAGCNSSRFVCVMDDTGVLDRETGLTWDRDPVGIQTTEWLNASGLCIDSATGERFGWRLPEAHELASLIDANEVGTALPPGHPFISLHAGFYWTATEYGDTAAYAIDFVGPEGYVIVSASKATLGAVWCVRG
jgi:hypothetical protein